MSMRRSKLDLNLLISLRELLAEKNVTRAGENVHVTQPAMSGILGRLRDYFDDALIVPVGRRMELTPLGASLAEPINDLLLRIEATLNIRPDFDPASSQRHFTIIASDYVTNVLLLDVLAEVNREASGVKVELIPPSPNAAEILEEGEVDFIITPEPLISDKHPSRPMFEDSYVVVADRGNTAVGDTITLDDYFAAGHAMVNKQGMATFENWFSNQHDDKRRVEVVTHNFALLPHLVLNTRRLATMHKRLAQRYVDLMSIRIVQPVFHLPRLVEVLQWHSYREMDPGCIWLRDKIIAASQRLPAS